MKKNRNLIFVLVLGFILLPYSAFAQTDDDNGEDDQTVEESVEDGVDGTTVDTIMDESDVNDDDDSIDNNDVVTDGVSSLFEIETAVGTQSVLSGTVPVYVYVKPKIDSTRAQLVWFVPRGLKAVTETEKWFSMEEDVGQTFMLEVEPQASGKYEIIVDVTAWRYDTNYVGTAKIDLEIDESLHVTPITGDYRRNQILLVVGGIVGGAGAAFGLYFLGKFGYRKFKEWLAKD